MTSTTQRYRAAASQPASTAEKIADFWTQGSQRLSDYMLPSLPQVDLVPVVERYFEFVHEQAGQAGQAGRELAREARQAEREQARHARDKARERYEGLTKAELSDRLDQRNLPKTGNVDELVERLVEADSK